MSKGGGKTEVVQNNAPWQEAAPHLVNIFNRGYQLSFQPQAQQTLQAQQMATDRALAGSPLTPAAQNQVLGTLRGDFANPFTSGALKDVMGMAKSQINSQFGGDNFGSSAHQEWLGRGLMSAAMPFAQQAHEAERGRQMQAAALAPVTAAQDFADSDRLNAVGQQIQNAPWETLFNYQRAVGNGGSAGGTSTQQQPFFQNDLANLAGLGLGAYGLWNAGLGSSLVGGLMGSPLTGAAALAMSDVRVKTDIEEGGENDGLNVYSFRYKGTPEKHVGYMAQEVLLKKPEAVQDIGGLLAVDYSKV